MRYRPGLFARRLDGYAGRLIFSTKLVINAGGTCASRYQIKSIEGLATLGRNAHGQGRPANRLAAPRTDDPARTMAGILEAATTEFAAKGLSGARIDEIAAATKTNKRMIYDYFGSKQACTSRHWKRPTAACAASQR